MSQPLENYFAYSSCLSASDAKRAIKPIEGQNVRHKRTSSDAQTSSPPASKISLSLPPSEEKSLFKTLPIGLPTKPPSSSVQQFSLSHLQKSVDVSAVQTVALTSKYQSTGSAETIAANSFVPQTTAIQQTRSHSAGAFNFSLPTNRSRLRERASKSQQLSESIQSPLQLDHLSNVGIIQFPDNITSSDAITPMPVVERCASSASVSTASDNKKSPHSTDKKVMFTTSKNGSNPLSKAVASSVQPTNVIDASTSLTYKAPMFKPSLSRARPIPSLELSRVSKQTSGTVEVPHASKVSPVSTSALVKVSPLLGHVRTGSSPTVALTTSAVNPLDQIEKVVSLKTSLIGRILFGRHSADIHSLQDSERVTIKMLSGGKQVKIRGVKEKVHCAAEKMEEVLDKLQENLECKKFNIETTYIPFFLVKKDALRKAEEIAQKNCVEFLVSQTSSRKMLSLTDFSQLLRKQCTKEPLKVVDLEKVGVLHRKSVRVWGKLDKTGMWTPWSERANQVFNQKLRDASLEPFWYDESGVMFEIDLSSRKALDICSKSSYQLQIVDKAEESVWSYYQDDNFGFVPYQKEEQDQIEKCLLYGSAEALTCRGSQCVFDYDKMLEHDIKINQVTSVKRDPPFSSSMLTQRVTFAVEGLTEDLGKAMEQLDQLMQGAIEVHTDDVILPRFLINFPRQYCVRTKCSETKTQIEGISEYLSKVLIGIYKALSSQAANQPKLSRQMSFPGVPDHWEPQIEDTECKPVLRNSEEWMMVENEWKKTMYSTPIKEIERIQNKWLWKQFILTKQRMSERNQGIINERLLFHGTRTTLPKHVFKSEHGFDPRFSNKGLWGTGSYFAVNANYSARTFAYESQGRRQVFLAMVLTGNAKEMTPSPQTRTYRVPPLKTDNSGDRYDTVTGFTNGSQVFVVYDHSQAYPAYLITF